MAVGFCLDAGAMLREVFQGSAHGLLQSALAGRKVDRAELAEIRRLLDDHERPASLRLARRSDDEPAGFGPRPVSFDQARNLLAAEADMEVVGEASNGAEAIEGYLQTKSVWINNGPGGGNPFIMKTS